MNETRYAQLFEAELERSSDPVAAHDFAVDVVVAENPEIGAQLSSLRGDYLQGSITQSEWSQRRTIVILSVKG